MNSREIITDSIKQLANTKNEGVGVDEAGSVGATSTDIPPGLRKGILKKINPKMKNGYIYEVYFPESNTTAYAKINAPLGIGWAPEGVMKKGIFYPSEECEVSLQMINDTSKWEIVGASDYNVTIKPGATTIERGGIVFEVRSDWVYIDNKKVCVEPCSEEQQQENE